MQSVSSPPHSKKTSSDWQFALDPATLGLAVAAIILLAASVFVCLGIRYMIRRKEQQRIDSNSSEEDDPVSQGRLSTASVEQLKESNKKAWRLSAVQV